MININNAELWYETYMDLSTKEKDEYIMETLKKSLSEEFVKEIDFVGFIIELFDDFMERKDYEKMFKVYNDIVENNENLINEEFYFIDNKFIDYYLFKQDKEKLNLHLKSFINNPIDSIDYLIPMINKLCCYGYDDVAVDICEKIYFSVKNSNKLFGNVEGELSKFILMYKIQEMYTEIKKENLINQENILEFLRKYDLDITKHYNMIVETLKSDMANFEIIKSGEFEYDEKENIQRLELYFCKYMMDEKNISFNVSSDLWYSAIENTVENRKIKNEEYAFDEYFFIDDEKYDEYLGSQFQFLSLDRLGAFKIGYGIHYVYDFLYKYKLISQEAYESSLQIIEEKRKLVLKSMNEESWKYNFVCIWNKADSIDVNDYTAEKDFIEKTFYANIDFKKYMPKEYMESFKRIEKRIKEKERESKTIRKEINIGRNDPCPCGSGKKYKKCCGK
ncbi:SEC-C metal-binding domain-containing protein [Clostridium sp. KNHs214]|uniref:SEC-C metal-binding domain-containing protein n=1 Tax=Clostridium sp. KNHs214 TaxID=1540257 RepID=UPI000B175304